MSNINTLFNNLMHSKLTETFSWASLALLFLLLFLFLLACNLYIIFRNEYGHRYSKKFMIRWEIGSVLLSLVGVLFLGRTTNILNKNYAPVEYEYSTTTTKSAKKSLTKISNELPYTLMLSDNNERYYVFSKSSNEINKLTDDFNTDVPDSPIIFLNTNSDTIVVEATFKEYGENGFLQKYKIVKHIGLSSDNYSAKFKNTNQMQMEDLEQ